MRNTWVAEYPGYPLQDPQWGPRVVHPIFAQLLSKELPPPFMMKPAPPLTSRWTFPPHCGQCSSFGSEIRCS